MDKNTKQLLTDFAIGFGIVLTTFGVVTLCVLNRVFATIMLVVGIAALVVVFSILLGGIVSMSTSDYKERKALKKSHERIWGKAN